MSRRLRLCALVFAVLLVAAASSGCKPSVPADAQEVAMKFLMARYGGKYDEALGLASGDARATLLGTVRPPEYTYHGASFEQAEGNRDGSRWSLVYTVTWELKEDGNTYYGQHEVTLDLMKFEDGWKVYSFLWTPLPKT